MLVVEETLFDRELVPADVGLTDSCQWLAVVEERSGSRSRVRTPGQVRHGLGLRSVYKHIRQKEEMRPRTNKYPGEKEVSKRDMSNMIIIVIYEGFAGELFPRGQSTSRG